MAHPVLKIVSEWKKFRQFVSDLLLHDLVKRIYVSPMEFVTKPSCFPFQSILSRRSSFILLEGVRHHTLVLNGDPLLFICNRHESFYNMYFFAFNLTIQAGALIYEEANIQRGQ